MKTQCLVLMMVVVGCGSEEKPPAPFFPLDAAVDGQDAALDSGLGYDASDAAIEPGPSDDSSGHVLIDASRAGALWWSPQLPTDPDLSIDYRGKHFTDLLTARGLDVDVLNSSDRGRISDRLLSGYEAVVRVVDTGHTDAENAAYERYVEHGGNLLLVADLLPPGETDALAARFDIVIEGRTRGRQFMVLLPDVINPELEPNSFILGWEAGSGVTSAPTNTRWLAELDDQTFLDLDDNGTQSSNEPSAPRVNGITTHGEGLIYFIADAEFLQIATVPITDLALDELVPSNAGERAP